MDAVPFDPQALLTEFRRILKAQRYVVLGSRGGELELVASHGVDGDLYRSAVISHAVFERVWQSGEPVLSEDFGATDWRADFDSNTFLLSDIQSVLCVPVFDAERKVMAVLYADHLTRKKAFSFTDLLNVRRLASRFEPRPPAPEPLRRAAPAPTVAPRAAPALSAPATVPLVLRAKDRLMLLRTLSNYLEAGISLLQGLEGLAAAGETPAIRTVADRTASSLLAGRPLSMALAAAGEFPSYVVRALQVGERSGALSQVLHRLSVTEERAWQNRQRLISQLAYPLFLLVACLILATALPSCVLSGQLQALQNQGQELPALSLWMLRVGQWLARPSSWLIAVVGAWLLLRSLPRLLQTPAVQRNMMRIPYVGGVLSRYCELHCCLSLALTLGVGMSLLEAVPLAVNSCGLGGLEPLGEAVLVKLRNGVPLSVAVRVLPFFTSSTRAMLYAGEESGKVASSLEASARLLQIDLESALDSATAALEPAILLLMGLLVGTVTLAALLPSVRLIESL